MKSSIPYASKILQTILLNPHIGASGLPYMRTLHASESMLLRYMYAISVYLHVHKNLMVLDILLYLL